jgi:hypothetical protein
MRLASWVRKVESLKSIILKDALLFCKLRALPLHSTSKEVRNAQLTTCYYLHIRWTFSDVYCHLINDSLIDAAIAHPHRTHEDYQIGVICALATEKAAIVAMLDETHPKLKKEDGDENEYTLGRIGVHNIVIACLLASLIGNSPAAIITKDMRRSFLI